MVPELHGTFTIDDNGYRPGFTPVHQIVAEEENGSIDPFGDEAPNIYEVGSYKCKGPLLFSWKECIIFIAIHYVSVT
jgi:hypothetical protein